jgi:hypothetical protein
MVFFKMFIFAFDSKSALLIYFSFRIGFFPHVLKMPSYRLVQTPHCCYLTQWSCATTRAYIIERSAPRLPCPILISSPEWLRRWMRFDCFAHIWDVISTWYYKWLILIWFCVLYMLVDSRVFNSSHEALEALYLVISWQGAQFVDCLSYFELEID